jgi:gluconate 5-dehydrogenase
MGQLDVFSLHGRVAIVAGGGGAIGSALSAALAGAGATVAIIDRTIEKAEASAAGVRAAGADALAIVADVTEPVEAESAVAQAVDQFGRLDIIVNAVGGGAGNALHPAESYPQSDWDWILKLNLQSTVVATQAAVRAMIQGGHGGRVLSVSSVRGQLGINSGYMAYVAAKGAINSLTRQWATEWAKFGITVNAIAPTFVDTPQVATLLGDPKFKAEIVDRIPLRRVGETRDLLGAVLLFCSDASSFITGQILTIDGGLTATQ